MTTTTIDTTARLLAGTRPDRPLTLDEHRHTCGELPHRDLAWLVAATGATGLRGRGGAAFPVATKLAATPAGRTTEVVVNGSESEPASAKDRTLMWFAPHQVLDGALVTAAALRTDRVTIAVHDRAAAGILTAAAAERGDARGVRVELVDGGFVSGEVRAVLSRLGDGAAVPPGRRVLPHVSGLAGHPTFASNVETFAQIGALARMGPERFGTGTSLLTLVGDVPVAGVVEAPHGVGLETLTGPLHGRPVLIGGYHGSWTTQSGLRLERDLLREAGSPLGAGVIAVLPDATCPLGEISRVTTWLAAQSARQCGPCLFGLHSVATDLAGIHAGARRDLDALRARVGLLPGRGACAHPDGAARFVATALTAYAEEVGRHMHGSGCGRPTLGVLPLGGAA